MNRTSSYVERWYPSEAWRHWLPASVHPVIDALSKKGVSVCRIGSDGNYKAPIVYVFVDSEFSPDDVLASLPHRAGMKPDADGIGILSPEYAWVGFEAGVCPTS